MLYKVEVYEIHAQKFAVEAESRAKAIRAFWDGEGEPVDLSLFIESCEDLGLSQEEVPDVYADLIANGDKLDGFIPCIRSVEVSHD